MTIFNVGRLCVKIAGRDAGNTCVVVEKVDDTFVVIDGSTRRKRVNVKHLEPLLETVELPAGASHEEVSKLFQEKGWKVWNTNAKTVAARSVRKRKVVEKKETVPKAAKKAKKEATE